MVVITWLKIVLILVAIPGTRAAAITATKPASNAYSIKSWPRRAIQNCVRRRPKAVNTCIHRY